MCYNQSIEFKETESIELKRADSDTIEKEIVAFLNTRDGIIYVGVEDNGEIVGVNNIDKLHKKYADIITNNIHPNAQDLVDLESMKVGNKSIVIIKIKKGSALYYIKRYGRSSQGLNNSIVKSN